MKAIICHSGGMDSSICLKLAIEENGPHEVLSVGFDYGQRHKSEEEAACLISRAFGVEHISIPIPIFALLRNNALLDHTLPIENLNTLVPGRNGLMAWHAALLAHSLGAHQVYLGVMELEEANSGYRDCSRAYMSLLERILQIDLNDKAFRLCTPLVHMTKKESHQLAAKMGILPFLLEHTVTCYEGIKGRGCEKCPACILRNKALD
ncbi:MAG: 7-cyano-7-deazaguanine synthase [Chlamydiae bacterium]|nr:7-cyano-7-deazaguanine synthase [Chlamydiota bacterium]